MKKIFRMKLEVKKLGVVGVQEIEYNLHKEEYESSLFVAALMKEQGKFLNNYCKVILEEVNE